MAPPDTFLPRCFRLSVEAETTFLKEFFSENENTQTAAMHKPLEDFHRELNELFIKACQDHQQGHLEAAESAYCRLLDYFAEMPILHYNLGLVDYALGRYHDACRRFSRAAEFQPDDADILFNLALSRKQSGDVEGAIAGYRQALQISPECIDTLYNLAGCQRDKGDHLAAVALYRDVLRLAPHHHSALSNLAYLYHLLGRRQEALRAYRRVLELCPDHSSARHMLAALCGEAVDSPPESYVREVFDNYSNYFEKSLLQDLEYCVPEQLRAMYGRIAGEEVRRLHGLDLGCGTGLGGQAFIGCIDRLDGIDLSPKMIALAGEKAIYRELYPESIAAYLKRTKDRFDFYLASDVLAYLGDLQETFLLLRERGRAGTVFLFSTEGTPGNGYLLQETGRFAHSAVYIAQLAGRTGWQVISQETARLRKERGDWVTGELWLLKMAEGW
jgi:predicted TPR repeat methyltransferase